MSHSNLALLDRAVQGAVAHELGDGDHNSAVLAELGIEPRRTRTVAGLTVISNAARDAEVSPQAATMTDKLLRYRADRELVLGKLKRVGVEPIAVLPLTAWERICNSTGLFRFVPDGDKVRISAARLIKQAETDAMVEASKKQAIINRKWAGMWALGAIITGVLALTLSGGWWVATAISVVATIGNLGSSEPNWRPRDIEARLINERVAELEKNGTLLKELWPDLIEPAKGPSIRIALPTPPAEVQERLIAAERARLPLNIAVVGDAIAFKESVAGVLINERKSHWDEVERQRQEALRLDPIAYVIEGTAVAIIDQYGDFPIEKAVMNEVINSEHLV